LLARSSTVLLLTASAWSFACHGPGIGADRCPEEEECPERDCDCEPEPCDSAPPDSDPPDSDPPDTGDTGQPSLPMSVALYDDSDVVGSSAWAAGLDYIQQAMEGAGHTVTRISREQLNETPGALSGYDALLFGGGYAYPGYTYLISAAGKARIQEYVHGGGVYVGTCAGAYFVCSSLAYEGQILDDESGYDIDLYQGACGGPVDEVSSYPDWAPASVSFPGHAAYEGFDQAPFERQIYYAGGPFFEDPPAEAEVLATYHDEGEHQGSGALITQPYGAGRIVLWGPHPEVLRVLSDPKSELDPGNRDLYAQVVAWAAGG